LLTLAALALYAGELRGNIKAMQKQLLDLTDDKLRERFMPREVVEERLRALDRRTHQRGHE